MVPFAFWQRWLVAVGVAVTAFGLGLALLNQTPIFEVLFNDRVNSAFFGNGPLPSDANAFQRWIYGVLGATVAGWGVTMTFIAAGPFLRRERWSWTCLASSVVLWFSFDTAISLAFRVGVNVVFNIVLLIAVGFPLVFARKHFTSVVAN
jgi:hypothetical protein